ncbi:MAG: hypothetical protein Q7V57_10195 [Actinomycetota bacterium]|nr:hypothetical protein [Actinomycetota bacterium]
MTHWLRRWWRFLLACVPLVAAIVFVWAEAGSSGTAHDDFNVPVLFGEVHDTVFADGVWGVEYDTLDGHPSLRFRVGDTATQWLSAEYAQSGAGSGLVEGDGHRIVWGLIGATDTVTVRWWSSAQRGVEYTSVPVTDSTQLIAFELAPGENPWGVQVFDSDGKLLFVTSYVGR